MSIYLLERFDIIFPGLESDLDLEDLGEEDEDENHEELEDIDPPWSSSENNNHKITITKRKINPPKTQIHFFIRLQLQSHSPQSEHLFASSLNFAKVEEEEGTAIGALGAMEAVGVGVEGIGAIGPIEAVGVGSST